MSKTDASSIWNNLSPEEKQLAREYVKAAIQAKTSKIALKKLLNIDEIDDKFTAKLAEDFLIQEASIQENTVFLKEAIKPLLKQRIIEKPVDIPTALCLLGCLLSGKSEQQCQNDCPH